MSTCEMSDLGLLHYFFGIEVSQMKDGIFIYQRKYTENVLKKFNILGCKSMDAPLIVNEKLKKDKDGAKKANVATCRSLTGSLLYLITTRPDIMFAARLLSRYMQDPSLIHFGAAKRVLRYLRGTIDYGITFKTVENSRLIGYYDSDWTGCLDDMKSTSGYVFSLGSGVYLWASKKQKAVAQSTAEAE
ncbi:hypothetical protein ACOSP7_012221 [Xanthoceras sorbifolium]